MPRARSPKKTNSDESLEDVLPEPIETETVAPEPLEEPAPTARKPRKRKAAAGAVVSESDSDTAGDDDDADPTGAPPARPPRRLIPLSLFSTQTRIRRWVWWTLGGAALVLVGLVASWFLLPIKSVTVSGNSHLTEAQVRDLAGAQPGFGWLYYGRRRAAGLLRSPWIQSARVTRQFPGTVSIDITERQPLLRVQNSAGEIQAVASDGELLPDATGTQHLPLVSGWGPPRLIDAVRVARALSRYTVQSVTYTPSGLTIKTANATVWSGDPNSLMKYAGSISMYPNQKINVYPWGVSVQ